MCVCVCVCVAVFLWKCALALVDSMQRIAVLVDVCTCASGKPATAITDTTLCRDVSANTDNKFHAVCEVGRGCSP